MTTVKDMCVGALMEPARGRGAESKVPPVRA
jgi:hypothetical protein